MGRRAGHLALYTGIASGAETILVPEIPFELDAICEKIKQGYVRGKLHSIIIVAEGAGNSIEIGKTIQEKTGLETRAIILGHLQRGGNPSAYDRILASSMGGKAVDLITQNVKDKMVGVVNGEFVATDIEKVLSVSKPLNMQLYELADILSL